MATINNTPLPVPSYMRFIIGGVSGACAACVTHPLDFTKTRMQVQDPDLLTKRKNTLQTLKLVVKNEGFTAIYSGLSAAILRQFLYTSGRMGFFSLFIDMGKKADGKPPGFAWKTCSGLVAGALGALIGNPADVAMIRMSADGLLPPAERRSYRNVIQAIVRIFNEEGFRTLYTGAMPTMGRAMLVNISQVTSYVQLKETFLKSGRFKDDVKCHLVVSMISGVITVLSTMPVDIAKTRIQNQKATISGKLQYRGFIDLWTQIIKNEGVLALWKGITPAYLRIAPHTVLFFLLLENLTLLYKVQVLHDSTTGGL